VDMGTAIRVDKIDNRFVARCSYDQREIPKGAGFRWDAARKHWYTTDAAIAAKLSDTDTIIAEVAAKTAAKAERIEASRAATANVDLPCPEGLTYLPYQRAGIAAALGRNNVLFGDEMGLGKTIQAIGIVNADTSIKRILVVCPASLRLNWKREMDRWLITPRTIGIVNGTDWPENTDITIINYDVLHKHVEKLYGTTWDLVITDEAHYLKSKDARRSKVVFGIDDYAAKKAKCEPTPGIQARRKVALTGTPIPNRPIEGYGLFHWLAPDKFKNFFQYAIRFCAGHQTRFGWDFTGSSHLDQLQDSLRENIMIRRLKADVLTELPAKRRCIIEIPANGASEYVAREMEAWERQESEIENLRVQAELAKAGSKEEYEAAVLMLRTAATAAFTEMSKLRHDTAMATVPYACQHIIQALNDGGGKIVVMAHHKDVVKAIMDAMKAEDIDAVQLTGDTPMQTRQDNVDRFQSDPKCRVFVGNIQAAGVGITLTAAAHVIFAELDWVPGNMTQAEDRCHRIGQTDSVLVQHLVLEGSLSARMAKVLIEKQEIIDRALDRMKEEPETPVIPTRHRAATEGTTQDKLQAIAETLKPEQITAIHKGLRLLADMDEDLARALNGVGYSKMDVAIGHSLAERAHLNPRQAALGLKLVNKYRRQLGPELIATAKGESKETAVAKD